MKMLLIGLTTALLLSLCPTRAGTASCSDYSVYCYRHSCYAYFDHDDYSGGHHFRIYCHGYGYNEHCLELMCE